MANLKKQYRDLEQTVFRELRNKVENSKHLSTHTNEKAIKIDISDYKELTLINDRLTFLNEDGHQFSIHVYPSLEDLIDILNK